MTQGPGLVGSLLVGVSVRQVDRGCRSACRSCPCIISRGTSSRSSSHNGELPLPSVVLVVSGGHTSLYYVPRVGEYHFVGRTRDDAAGEAYDKVAKLLGLGYPGGPIVDKLAKKGNDRAIDFPVAKLSHRDRNAGPEGFKPAGFEDALRYRTDFSFSGVKTAVMRYVKQRNAELGVVTTATSAASMPPPAFSEQEVADVCASFQRAVVEALVDRTFDAAGWLEAKSVGIAGGVSANSRLRQDAIARGERAGIPVFVPSLALTTDNAAMIAAAGLRRLHAGITAGMDLNAQASLTL